MKELIDVGGDMDSEHFDKEHQLLDADSPGPVAIPANWEEEMDRSLAVAERLANEIHKRGLYTKIGPSNHIRLPGWQLVGLMLGGLGAHEVAVSRDADGTWHARYELRFRDGGFAGDGSAMLSPDESNWKGKPEHARRSMAITRAIVRCYANSYRILAELAGFSGTPAEEMDHEATKRARGSTTATPKTKKPKSLKEVYEPPEDNFLTIETEINAAYAREDIDAIVTAGRKIEPALQAERIGYKESQQLRTLGYDKIRAIKRKQETEQPEETEKPW